MMYVCMYACVLVLADVCIHVYYACRYEKCITIVVRSIPLRACLSSVLLARYREGEHSNIAVQSQERIRTERADTPLLLLLCAK